MRLTRAKRIKIQVFTVAYYSQTNIHLSLKRILAKGSLIYYDLTISVDAVHILRALPFRPTSVHCNSITRIRRGASPPPTTTSCGSKCARETSSRAPDYTDPAGVERNNAQGLTENKHSVQDEVQISYKFMIEPGAVNTSNGWSSVR